MTATKMRRVDALLADICRMFDVIALQGVQAQEDYIIPRLTELMNKQGGRDFDYLVGPRLGPPGYQQQYAFVYDQQAVMCDRPELYTIDDRDNLMVQEPLVAWFRTVRAPADKAFTFSLVNVSVEPEHAQLELAVLDNVLLNVRDDGRGEDDVILAGHFAAPSDQLGDLNRLSGIGYAVASLPTDVEGRNSLDNIVFDKNATIEFNGKSGVLDFLRELNLSLQEAVDISRHLPVWAEFSIYEGGEKGRMATLSRQTQ
ncbi:MAG: endonuclease/exonuclease/phosphatase [Pirellulaceae bacterium]